MRGDDELMQHCCKVCGKSFPTGRSLGGHMRCHVAPRSPAGAEERTVPPAGATYVLRENPRKTWRLCNSPHTGSADHKCCRECGKGFPSWRSLFGHMRCHSGRRREVIEEEEDEEDEVDQELEEQEGSWSLDGGKKGSEGRSSTEAAGAVVPRRRPRSKRVAAIPDSSSSVSERDKTEQEDVALCLLMLSKDAGFWGGVSPVLAKNSAVARESDEYEIVHERRKGSELGVGGGGCLRNGLKKVESDVSDNGFAVDDESKKPKNVFEDCSRKKNLSSIDELQRQASVEPPNEDVGKHNSSKRMRIHAYDGKLVGESFARFGFDGAEKRGRFECTACKKVFHSYQALGGHRASHKRTNGCSPLVIASSEISIESNASIKPALIEEIVNTSYRSSKRFKGHECPICSKVFASGQALGGHKRSHLVANSTIVIERQAPAVMPELLDLNLPAPMDEESTNTNVSAERKPWWVKSELRSEPLVGLISH